MQPLPNAALEFQCDGKKTTRSVDANGLDTFDLPVDLSSTVFIIASAPERPTLRATYVSMYGEPLVFPDTVEFVIPAAKSIGGTVVDEHGNSVAGATLQVSVYGDNSKQPSIYLQQIELISDANGNWSYPYASDEIISGYIEITHPEFGRWRQNFPDQSDKPDAISVATLLGHNARHVMPPGALVHGIVTDSEGNALPDVRILCNDANSFPGEEMSTTDASGSFRFHWTKGKVRIAISDDNWAPAMQIIDLNDQTPPMAFSLRKGRTLRGRVVSPAGLPLENIRVGLESWQSKSNRYAITHTMKTDAQGRFEWLNAPNEPFTIEAYGRGILRIRELDARCDGEEMVLTALPELRFTGTVVDAASGQPITDFTIVPMWESSGRLNATRPQARQYSRIDGSFSYAIDFPRDGHALIFEADGYLPFQTGTFEDADGHQKLAIKLERATPLQGVVVDANGAPVANATVYLANEASFAHIRGGKPFREDDLISTTTDLEGNFSLTRQLGGFALVAISDTGIGILTDADFKAGEPFVIQKWSSVEGQLTSRGSPIANRAVWLETHRQNEDSSRFVQISDYQTTDENGRFAFAHVSPGPGRVVEQLVLTEMSSIGARFLSFESTPGSHIELDFENSGASVACQATAPKDGGRAIDMSRVRIGLRKSEEPPKPQDWGSLDALQKQARMRDWWHSPEGQQWQKRQFLESHFYHAFADPDGRFLLEAVQPGEYQLTIEAFDPKSQWYQPSDCYAKHESKLTIEKRRDQVDLGELELVREARVFVGDAAPDFEIRTVDGEPLKLSDYRGRFVFLDFWATWCGPCKAEMPHLKSLHEAFRDRADFTVISLSLDQNPELPRQYARDQGMNWPQGFLGDWSKDTVAKMYGVQGIPATFLVGPDGNVVARDLRGPQMIDAVRAAITKR